jgi:hypothetical protein
MTLTQCMILKNKYRVGGICEKYNMVPVGDPIIYPAIYWIGQGCESPCSQTAKKLGVNPTAYCKSLGNLSPRYPDGGCSYWSVIYNLSCHLLSYSIKKKTNVHNKLIFSCAQFTAKMCV